MDKLKEFMISFSGLSLGHHQYDLKVDDSFFECFEYSEINNGSVDISLDLEKNERFVMLNFIYKGKVTVACDRCLEDITESIMEKNRLIVKFGEYDDDDFTDEIIMLSDNEHEVDVSKFVYDSIVLAIPSQKTHKNIEDCNQDMISRMQESEEEDLADPRWNALKGLKFED